MTIKFFFKKSHHYCDGKFKFNENQCMANWLLRSMPNLWEAKSCIDFNVVGSTTPSSINAFQNPNRLNTLNGDSLRRPGTRFGTTDRRGLGVGTVLDTTRRNNNDRNSNPFGFVFGKSTTGDLPERAAVVQEADNDVPVVRSLLLVQSKKGKFISKLL